MKSYDAVVLGGSGVIGRNLVRLLRSNGTKCLSIDRDNTHDADSLFMDLSIPSVLKDFLRRNGADIPYLIHLAHEDGGCLYKGCNQHTYAMNAAIDANVLDAILDSDYDGSIIYGGTSYTIGMFNKIQRCYEEMFRTTALDSKDKFSSVKILNIHNTYGDSVFPSNPIKRRSIESLIRRAASLSNNAFFLVSGNSGASRYYVHVDDVCSAIIKAMPVRESGIWDIMGEENITVKNIIDKLSKISGKVFDMVDSDQYINGKERFGLKPLSEASEFRWEPRKNIDSELAHMYNLLKREEVIL